MKRIADKFLISTLRTPHLISFLSGFREAITSKPGLVAHSEPPCSTMDTGYKHERD